MNSPQSEKADYPAILRSGNPVRLHETTIAPSPVAEAEQHETEEQGTRAAGAELADALFATAVADYCGVQSPRRCKVVAPTVA